MNLRKKLEKQTEKLEENGEQIARIEEKVKSIDENFKDFRGEQRVVNDKHEGKLDKILDKLSSL